jgi:hypothetical protein
MLIDLQRVITKFSKEHELIPLNSPNSFSSHITIGEAKSDILMDELSHLEAPREEYYAETMSLQHEIERLTFEIIKEYRLNPKSKID